MGHFSFLDVPLSYFSMWNQWTEWFLPLQSSVFEYFVYLGGTHVPELLLYLTIVFLSSRTNKSTFKKMYIEISKLGKKYFITYKIRENTK